MDRLLPYHMFADDDDESADLRESLGLDWQTEPGPLLCSSRQIVQTLLQEKAKDYVYRSAALARKFAAVEEQSRVLRANHTLPEVSARGAAGCAERVEGDDAKAYVNAPCSQDGLRMEREQMESARNTWHREMLVWDETIAQCDQAQKAHEQKKNAAAMAAAHAARAGQAGVSAPGVGQVTALQRPRSFTKGLCDSIVRVRTLICIRASCSQMAYTAYRPQMPGTQPGAPFMYLPTTGPTSTPQQFYYPMMPGAGAPQVMMPAQVRVSLSSAARGTCAEAIGWQRCCVRGLAMLCAYIMSSRDDVRVLDVHVLLAETAAAHRCCWPSHAAGAVPTAAPAAATGCSKRGPSPSSCGADPPDASPTTVITAAAATATVTLFHASLCTVSHLSPVPMSRSAGFFDAREILICLGFEGACFARLALGPLGRLACPRLARLLPLLPARVDRQTPAHAQQRSKRRIELLHRARERQLGRARLPHEAPALHLDLRTTRGSTDRLTMQNGAD